MGVAEIDGKQALIDTEDGFIVENPRPYVPPRRRGLCRRTHPLWNLVKVAATIGSIGMLSYGVIKYSDSEQAIGIY